MKGYDIMKLFIDTANVDDIRWANDLGVICGVTTNPSLIAKEGRVFEEVVKEITTIVDGPISAEVISLEADKMVEEALPLAANAGATYVSPFLGRLDDIGMEGLKLIEEIVQIFSAQCIDTKIIAASIRNPIHVTACAGLGCDIATVPANVIRQMIKHPMTDNGIERFLKDWEGAKSK